MKAWTVEYITALHWKEKWCLILLVEVVLREGFNGGLYLYSKHCANPSLLRSLKLFPIEIN